jgi:hypothetical protein
MFQILESKKYNPGKTAEWTETIGNKIIEQMKDIAPNFKYIVSICIVQKVGAGLHCETISYWDSKTDGMIQCKFENESLISLCTLCGVSI